MADEGKKRGEGGRRAKLIDAIAHPVRRRMLRALIELREPRSPVQLGRELDHPAGMVAYHARVLQRYRAVKPTSEQTAHGAVEHLYTTTIEDDPPIETLLEETREIDEKG